MKNITLIILALFCSSILVAEISPKEKQALVDLYNSTNGNEWTNSWDLSQTPENWMGVTIFRDKVFAVSLKDNNLTGTIL